MDEIIEEYGAAITTMIGIIGDNRRYKYIQRNYF